VDLPTFNGNAKEWPTFYKLFSELIDGRKDLSNTRKLRYLRACLKGEAEMVVSHLITGSAASYTAAWERGKNILPTLQQINGTGVLAAP